MALRLVVPPSYEPITLEEAKLHLRVTHDEQDDLIVSLIAAARQAIESFTSRVIVSQTWELLLDRFPACSEPIRLPIAPVREVVSIRYVDTQGATQTWSATEYVVDTSSLVARLAPASGYHYPPTRGQLNAVTVQFRAGYEDPALPAAIDWPEPLRQAMLFKLQELYDGVEKQAVIDSLCGPYRLHFL